MKLIDCFMYYDEDMMLDIRLNILNKFVSNFIICEANFHHNGTKRELKFDIRKFSKFKDKIIYIPLTEQPKQIKEIKDTDSQLVKNSKILDNALLRENFQRNHLQSKIKNFHENDLIIISDLDEIPNLEKFTYKARITFFIQKMYYYKLNLIHKNFNWYGSKIVKKKDLINPQWLRNVKTKKYPIWRLDILFSKKRYTDIQIIEKGGWHFTNIKTPEEIHHKMKKFLHHFEYENSGLKVEDIQKLIKEKKALYNYSADQRQNKWSENSQLKTINLNLLPKYISDNKDKYTEWLEN